MYYHDGPDLKAVWTLSVDFTDRYDTILFSI